MISAAPVSVDEYLDTSYEPDKEFVDGVLLKRNVGTQRHGRLQALLAIFFGQFRRSHRLAVFTETRLLLDGGRHRIPDVMVLRAPFVQGRVVTDVPALIVEIKSPDDTFDNILDRCYEYEHTHAVVIVMDPDNKRAWIFNNGSLQLLAGTNVQLKMRDRDPIDFPFRQLLDELDGND